MRRRMKYIILVLTLSIIFMSGCESKTTKNSEVVHESTETEEYVDPTVPKLMPIPDYLDGANDYNPAASENTTSTSEVSAN